MASVTRRAILSCGLGKHAASDANATAHFGPDTGAKTREMLNASLEKAKAAGFDVFALDANPRDPADTMSRIKEALRSTKFDGINIGFGIRGHKEHTELFENILNTACEMQPGIKIMFSTGPDEIYTAIRRVFPEAA